jgi:hypothetical protein
MAQQETAEKIRSKVKESISRVMPSSGSEGELTKRIEEQTARIPSLGYLGLAVGSMVISGALALFSDRDRKPLANFVGLWAPTFLLIGLYNKLVKLEGSDRFSRHQIAGGGDTEAA